MSAALYGAKTDGVVLMRANDVIEGGVYVARISGKLTEVKVNRICKERTTHYIVTNLATGRRVVFKSARRFRY